MKSSWQPVAPTQDVLTLIQKAVAAELSKEAELQKEVQRLKVENVKLRKKVSEQSIRADHWRYLAQKEKK